MAAGYTASTARTYIYSVRGPEFQAPAEREHSSVDKVNDKAGYPFQLPKWCFIQEALRGDRHSLSAYSTCQVEAADLPQRI